MQETFQLKKSLWRRFWWGLPILIVLIIVGIFVFDYFSGQGTRIVKTFKSGTDSAFYCNPPTIVDSFIYIGTSNNTTFEGKKDNYFFKLDLDLNKIWEYKLPEFWEVNGGAALDSQGNIYFYASKRGAEKKSVQELELYSLNNGGKFRWKKIVSYPGEIFASGPTTPAIGTDDTIYALDSKLFALKNDGTEKWVFPKNSQVFTGVRSSPVIDQSGNIYIATSEPSSTKEETSEMRIYKFAKDGNGIPLWSVKLDNNIITEENGGGYAPREIVSTPALTTGSKKIIQAIGNTVNCVDTETGKLLWSFSPPEMWGHFTASPAVDNQDNVYIGTKANAKSILYAIRSDGRGLLWENKIGSDLYSSPSLGEGGILYVGSEYTPDNGRLHAIDIKTGKYVWNVGNLLLKDFQKTSPTIHDGYIYIGTMGGTSMGPLMKIKIDFPGYLPGAAWPKFHGGNANNGRL